MKSKLFSILTIFSVLMLLLVSCAPAKETVMQDAQKTSTETKTDTANSVEQTESPSSAKTADNKTGTVANTTTVVQNQTSTTGFKQTRVIEVTAKQWEWIPSTITVKEGDDVVLKIKSLDVTHGFSLPAYDISRNIATGKETIIEFTANKKGAFSFTCSVFCGSGHRDMTGTLVVE